MIRNIEFIAFDTKKLCISEDHSAQKILIGNNVVLPRVTEKTESEIVSWLFGEHYIREHLFKKFKIEKPVYRLNTRQPIIENTNVKPGDIDILICGAEKPQYAIAIECKRVKVEVNTIDNDKINKINDIIEGIKQANSLHKMGFHNTYLGIIVEIDGRNKVSCNTISRGFSNNTYIRIYNFPQRERLKKEVGIIFIEIIQPTENSIDDTCMVGICIDREAKNINQPSNLTNRIINLLSR